MSSQLTSGTTSGTFCASRQAELLSTTSAPASTAMGANVLDTSDPVAMRTRSTSSKERSSSASTGTVEPLKRTLLPADRPDASAFSLATGNSRCASTRHISWPTRPVAPTTATFNP
jgi:hypothetical protein